RGSRGRGAAVRLLDAARASNRAGVGGPPRLYFVNGDPANPTGGGIGGSRLLVNRQIGTVSPDDTNGHGTGVASIAAGAFFGLSGDDDGHAPLAGIAGYSIATGNGVSDTMTMANAWQ